MVEDLRFSLSSLFQEKRLSRTLMIPDKFLPCRNGDNKGFTALRDKPTTCSNGYELTFDKLGVER